MAMQHLENEFRRQGKGNLADIIASVHKLNGRDIPFPSVATQIEEQAVKTPESAKIYPEISLDKEWQRQAQGLVVLGFHAELGLTEDEYLKSLPEFTSQPESFKGRLGTPVLVETRISPKRQSELTRVRYFLDGFNKTDWNKSLGNYKTPEAPYAAWLEDGSNNLKKKPKDVRAGLKADEIAGTELDGIALYVSNPKILEHHSLDLPGTSVESDDAACLYLWHDEPLLHYRLVGSADPEFGSVVRGRQK